MKNKQKILIILILSIFIVGMVMGAASASHTFKKGKYKVTVSDKTYKQIKKGNKYLVKKVGTKKVTKWTTKKIKTHETWIDDEGNLYKSASWNPYKKFGYKAKYVKSETKYYSDGSITWEWYKVPTTVKKPLYLKASAVFKDESHVTGKVKVVLSTNKY